MWQLLHSDTLGGRSLGLENTGLRLYLYDYHSPVRKCNIVNPGVYYDPGALVPPFPRRAEVQGPPVRLHLADRQPPLLPGPVRPSR